MHSVHGLEHLPDHTDGIDDTVQQTDMFANQERGRTMIDDLSKWKNKLYFGDNLDILREYFPAECVDLIYLDPPFNSQATYNVLFGEKNGSQSQAQITAFEDTWHWGPESQNAYSELIDRADKLSDLIEALQRFLGANDMMAYLVMMAIRLAELHRVLKPKGSIYLHCDPLASHYLKLIMDAVFGFQCYHAEIIWKRFSSHGNVYKNYGKVHDVVLFYSKTQTTKWNQPYAALKEDYVTGHFTHQESDTGRRYRLQNVLNPNKDRPNLTYEWNGHLRVWKWTKDRMQELHDQGRLYYSSTGYPALKQYLDESKGQKVDDVWNDIKPLTHSGKERLGYPTQKPEALLERIISASSNEGDLVLDPFCGCGTTIAVAERLRRRWIGIDITYLAITLVRNRLEGAFSDENADEVDLEKAQARNVIHRLNYEIIGDPRDLASARALADKDRHEFERWITGKLGASHFKDKKKGADSGIDGRIKFLEYSGEARTIIVQVKSGGVGVSQIRDLIGVVKREKAAIGVFVTLNPPTKPMEKEALTEGYFVPLNIQGMPDQTHKVPRIQILTVQDLLNGATLMYPAMIHTTFKKPERQYRERAAEQGFLALSQE